ncbi:MAG: TraR/DksA C4-type zinc finger protein [Dehalococcoidia bacterium]|nr:TraR/DksA C4-type zinc finger protein [Dehalococcoidia bacterium]
MTDVGYKLIQQRLEKDRKRLSEQLDDIRTLRSSDNRREGSPFGKREEEATETADLENMMAQEQCVIDQLTSIEAALKKFDLGTYGICEKCGQPIEMVRLEVMPTAKLCMNDARKNVR